MPLIINPQQFQKLQKKRKARSMRPGKPDQKTERNFKQRMQKLWEEVLFPITEQIEAAIKSGASLEYIADLIQSALDASDTVYKMRVDEIVTLWQLSLDRNTRRVFEQALRGSLGVDFTTILDDPRIKENLTVARMEAAQLITKASREQIGLLAKAVADNAYGTLPPGVSLMDRIQQVKDMTPARARLIARDQTAKLTGNLNRLRQQSIGIEEYEWGTMRDQRVVGTPGGRYPEGNKAHGDHYEMQGMYCKWDDSTVYSDDKGKTWKKRTAEMPKTHPGMDIQCRCYAKPVVDIEKIKRRAEVI